MINSSDKNRLMLWSIAAAIISSISALFALFDLTILSLVFVSISGLAITITTKNIAQNYFSVATIFTFFSLLYGVFGALGALSKTGLAPIFPKPYLVGHYLLHYALSNVGCAIALLVATASFRTLPTRPPAWRLDTLFLSSIILALVGSAFEMTNIFRAGGIQLIFAGKAAYQSAIADMAGTMPSEWIAYASVALFGTALSLKKRSARFVFAYGLSISFIVGTWIVLGRRLELLCSLLIFLTALRFFNPVRKIKTSQVAIFVIAYFAISLTYAVRGWVTLAYAYGDVSIVFEQLFDVENILNAVNPVSNEFQAPFGNFNTHAVCGTLEEGRMGATYIEGFTMPVPRFIWPDKPKDITYEFRDKYFGFEAERGSIAGTGFSSILEAYLNFGTAGVAVVYFFVSYVLCYLEVAKHRIPRRWFQIFYILLIPFAVFFPRQSLGVPFLWPLLCVFVSATVYSFVSSILISRRRPNRHPGLQEGLYCGGPNPSDNFSV